MNRSSLHAFLNQTTQIFYKYAASSTRESKFHLLGRFRLENFGSTLRLSK